MSRVEGFSDVVFGFALTLLVVSLEVPKTYEELQNVARGFLPFALCFAFLMTIWMAHFRFFRRYGLEDAGTIAVNALVLFLVLFYVYPVKFLFALVVAPHGGPPPFSHPSQQIRGLMELYGWGFAAIYWALALLYLRAWKLRDALELTPIERFITKIDMIDLFGTGCIGAVSVLVAFLLPSDQAGAAGYTFFLIGLYKHLHGRYKGRRLRELRAAEKTAASALGASVA